MWGTEIWSQGHPSCHGCIRISAPSFPRLVLSLLLVFTLWSHELKVVVWWFLKRRNEILSPVLSCFLSDYKEPYSSCVQILWTWTVYRRWENEIRPLHDWRDLLEKEKAMSVQINFLPLNDRVSENETLKEWTGELVAYKQGWILCFIRHWGRNLIIPRREWIH